MGTCFTGELGTGITVKYMYMRVFLDDGEFNREENSGHITDWRKVNTEEKHGGLE